MSRLPRLVSIAVLASMLANVSSAQAVVGQPAAPEPAQAAAPVRAMSVSSAPELGSSRMAAQAAGTTTLVSVNSAGESADDWVSNASAISGDGRYVAFSSLATNLDSLGDVYMDVYVHDRVTHQTTRVSVAPDGSSTDHDSPYAYYALAISPDGALLALKERGEVRLWRTDDGSLLRVLGDRDISTGYVAFAGDGRFLMASLREGTAIWERRESELVLVHTIPHDSECCEALSPDGNLLARFSYPNELLLRRVEDGARLRSLKTEHGEGGEGLLLSPDGSLLVTSGGGKTCLWGLAP